MSSFTICVLGGTAALLTTLHSAEGPLRLIAESVEIPERGEVTGYAALAAGRRFSFIPPAGWSVKPDGAKAMVNLLPENLGAGIRFQISTDEDGKKPKLQSEQLRQKVLKRYPEAKITDEFTCYTSDADGLAFDIERLVEQKTVVSSRIAFVAFDKGTVEFELTSSAKNIANYHFLFGALLSSFRVSPAVTK